MELRPLRISDATEALQGHVELAEENWEYLLRYEEGMPWTNYLEMLHDEALGRNLSEGRVQASFLIAESRGSLVGRVSIRHFLNDFLLHAGGHIGYGVRPEFRRQGFAKEILRQSLQYIYELGVIEVLVTCDNENVGSIRTIESQGGILENMVDHEGVAIRRYWIEKPS